MFWKLTALSATSPVDTILDKENFTLEELLDEEEIIQECKALNSRLINFLRDRVQVEKLLHYVIDEPPEDAESNRDFKFPFIACEIFTCEIDVILKTLVEEEELMNLLFSFLKPNRQHSTSSAGYFSKVVVCLMIRKTIPLMNYIKAHQNILHLLVDLIGITSIMEVLTRFIDGYPNFIDFTEWLAENQLLEMIVDKLCPSSPPEVHTNAAEILCAITRNMSSPLAIKLSSPSFVERIFGNALEDSSPRSGLVHSLSVCIALLDPKRSVASSFQFHSFGGQHISESSHRVTLETINAMLPKLGDLLKLLGLTSDEKILPTTYGELKPPLGKYRLKIVEFIAVLLRTGNEVAEKELVNSGTIHRVINLFFEYPYNNYLHHQTESIILSCLESKNDAIVDHILQECDLIGKVLQTDKQSFLSCEPNKPTVPRTGKQAPRVGYLGHVTRIANKLVQFANTKSRIHAFLQEINEWNEWQVRVLQERNAVENVLRWTCGRPTALQDRTRDSDDDDFQERDYNVAVLANNLSQGFGYNSYGNEDKGDDAGFDRDEDIYFDDGSAEVVISSLRLDDDQGSNLFTNSNWFEFQDDKTSTASAGTSPVEVMDQINFHGKPVSSIRTHDDELVIGKNEESTENRSTVSGTSSSNANFDREMTGNRSTDSGTVDSVTDKASPSHDMGLISETPDNKDASADRPSPDCVGFAESTGIQVDGSSVSPSKEQGDSNSTKVVVE